MKWPVYVVTALSLPPSKARVCQALTAVCEHKPYQKIIFLFIFFKECVFYVCEKSFAEGGLYYVAAFQPF